jgi:hypothetical protein
MEKSEVFSFESQKDNTNNEEDSFSNFVNPEQLLATTVCLTCIHFYVSNNNKNFSLILIFKFIT